MILQSVLLRYKRWVCIAFHSVHFCRLEFNSHGKTTERHKKRSTLLEFMNLCSFIALLGAPFAGRTLIVLTAWTCRIAVYVLSPPITLLGIWLQLSSDTRWLSSQSVLPGLHIPCSKKLSGDVMPTSNLTAHKFQSHSDDNTIDHFGSVFVRGRS